MTLRYVCKFCSGYYLALSYPSRQSHPESGLSHRRNTATSSPRSTSSFHPSPRAFLATIPTHTQASTPKQCAWCRLAQLNARVAGAAPAPEIASGIARSRAHGPVRCATGSTKMGSRVVYVPVPQRCFPTSHRCLRLRIRMCKWSTETRSPAWARSWLGCLTCGLSLLCSSWSRRCAGRTEIRLEVSTDDGVDWGLV